MSHWRIVVGMFLWLMVLASAAHAQEAVIVGTIVDLPRQM
jgi:hypothetical protein